MTTSSSKPELNLGAPPPRLRSAYTPATGKWLMAIAALQIVIVGLLWRGLKLNQPQLSPAHRPVAPDSTRNVALELENRSLHARAAEAWLDYLRGSPPVQDRAEVLYRIGQLYEQAEQFDRAAEAYIRCEQVATGESGIQQKLGPRVVHCLRQLGLYGEVGRELSRRVESGADTKEPSKVLATIAGEKITEAQLDRLIERQVDQMLAMQGGSTHSELREQFLKELSRPEAKKQAFEELLRMELFTRRARDLKIDQQESFLATKRNMENSLLASRFADQELSKIHPTDVDIESFYRSQEGRYREPESIEARIEELQELDDVHKLAEAFKSPTDFRTWQEERRNASKDKPDSKVASAINETIVRGKTHPRLGDPERLFALNVGEWTKEPVVHNSKRFLVLVESKRPATTPLLEQVRSRVQNDYVNRKREELSKSLLQDLMQRYDVKILQ